MTIIVNNILIYILTVLPLSVILLYFTNKITKDQKTNNLKTICIGASNTLIKNWFEIKTILFDKYILTIKKDQNNFEIFNTKEQKIENIDFSIKENEYMKIIASCTTLSKYKKTSKIEEALLNFFAKHGLNKSLIEREYSQINHVVEDKGKNIGTSIVRKNDTKEIYALSKGNAYKILENSTRIILNGKKEDINPAIRHKIKKQISKLYKKGKKVFAFAIRPLPLKILESYSSEYTEKDLIFVGMIAVRKPLNKENIRYIKEAQRLNIKLVLITQLKEKSAITIASEMGIINPKHHEAINGDYFETLNEQKKEKIIKDKEKHYLFCETKGKTKNSILKMLKEFGKTPIWTDKKITIKKTLENFKSNKRIQNNYKKIILFQIAYKIPLIVLLLAFLITKIPIPITVFTIIFFELLIIFPISLIIQGIKSKTLIKNLKLSLLKFSIINLTILIAIIVNTLYQNGFEIGTKIDSTNSILKELSTIILLWFVFTQVINIFLTIGNNAFKEKILNAYTIIIFLIIYFILTNDYIKTLFNTELITTQSTLILFSGLGTYFSLQYLLKKDVKITN